MRVAYVCADPGVPAFGQKGSSIHVQSMLRALLHHGATIDLFTMRPGGDPPADLAAVRIHALPRPHGEPLVRERGLLAANGNLVAALEQAGPFDLYYERYALWSHAGLEWAADRAVPTTLEVNAPLIEEQIRHRGLHHYQLAVATTARAFAAAQVLCAVSSGVAAYLERHPAARGRVHLLPNGVDPARFAPGTPPALPASEHFTVGFVGTLKPWHGVEHLLSAAALLRDSNVPVRILIVGDGPQRAALEQQAATLRLHEHVVFTGAVAPAAIPGLLRSMHVAVAPYPPLDEFYFSPLKLYEYLAAGVPTVASRIGQIAELISHEHTGLLYPPGDISALAAALKRLSTDTALRTRLAHAGRIFVGRNHSWNSVAMRMLAMSLPGVGASERQSTAIYSGIAKRAPKDAAHGYRTEGR
jgi:glycosyltransferase involved in cell wall biosynthesis